MKLVLVLMGALVLGSFDRAPISAEGRGGTLTGTLECRRDAAEPPRLLVVYHRQLVAGCTPVLQKFDDGTIAWDGCPTWNCVYPDECQGVSGSGGTVDTCKCRDAGWAGVLCQGVVIYNAVGQVINWDCFKEQCVGACRKQPAPGSGEFYVCDC